MTGTTTSTWMMAGSDGETTLMTSKVCPAFAESKIVEPLREILSAQGVQIIAAETVAATVLAIITGGATGEAWFVQPAREAAPFKFRNVPGPGVGQVARADTM